MPPATRPSFADLLGDDLLLRLVTLTPEVRRMVEHLVSNNAVARVLGLDGIFDCVLRQDLLLSTAPEALPFLFRLAETPRYPHASAILTRLASVLGTLDDPPRSMAVAGEEGRSRAPLRAEVWELFRSRVPALLRVARSSRDPESCRTAARLVGHFPEADEHLLPILFALMSGARGEEDRAPLLYSLAQIQASAGGPLHPRIERALEGSGPSLDKAAVAIALADHRLEDPLVGRVQGALEELAAAEPVTRGWPDPRAWGDRYVPAAVRSALERVRRA